MNQKFSKLRLLVAVTVLALWTTSARAQQEMNLDSVVNIIVEFKDTPMFYKTDRTAGAYRSRFDAFYSTLDSIVLNDSLAKTKGMAYQPKRKREYNRLLTAVSLSAPLYLKYKIKLMPDVKEVYDDGRAQIVLDESVSTINVDDVWAEPNCVHGAGIVVAILDSGIDYNHEALGNGAYGAYNPDAKVIGGWDFVNNDNNPMDDNYIEYYDQYGNLIHISHSHGTHVAGIVAGNSASLKGVAYEAKLLAYKAAIPQEIFIFHKISRCLHVGITN